MRTSDFDRLYAEHAASLFSFLAYRTGDEVEAEDVLSERVEEVTCRWCGTSTAVEELPG